MRLRDISAMGPKRLAEILELLGLGTGTIVTGLQQSRMECLNKEVLRKEINTSVSEAVP